jgi:hypothetical protein
MISQRQQRPFSLSPPVSHGRIPQLGITCQRHGWSIQTQTLGSTEAPSVSSCATAAEDHFLGLLPYYPKPEPTVSPMLASCARGAGFSLAQGNYSL